MRKFDLSLRSSRSSYFATFRHQLTILSKTDALDEEKWLNMLGTFVKDWFRYESHFAVLVIRLRSLRLLRVSGIVMRLRMFLLLITFLKASHSFRNRLLVICKNAYLFATMIMTSVSSPFS